MLTALTSFRHHNSKHGDYKTLTRCFLADQSQGETSLKRKHAKEKYEQESKARREYSSSPTSELLRAQSRSAATPTTQGSMSFIGASIQTLNVFCPYPWVLSSQDRNSYDWNILILVTFPLASPAVAAPSLLCTEAWRQLRQPRRHTIIILYPLSLLSTDMTCIKDTLLLLTLLDIIRICGTQNMNKMNEGDYEGRLPKI